MAKSWQTVNARQFLAETGSVRTGPHRMTGRVCHWAYCKTCGTMDLNNDVSRRWLRRACQWEE